MSARHTRTRGRAVAPWLAPAGVTVLTGLYLDPLLARRGMPFLARWPISAVTGATLMLPAGMTYAARHSDDFGYVRNAFRPGAMATACAVAIGATQLIVLRSVHAPPPGGAAFLGGGVLVSWTVAHRYLTEAQGSVAQRLLTVREGEWAAQLLAECRDRLTAPGIPPGERVVLELNAAEALIVLSARTDGDDQLDEAFALIEPAVRTAPGPLAFAAAQRMVEGMRAKALRTGDDVGWDQALKMLADASASVGDAAPEAPGLVHAARAERLEWRAERARAERDAPDAELLAAAARALEDAVQDTPDRLDHHALHVAQLARVRAAMAGDEDLDEPIALLTEATRRLRHATDPRARDSARVALADLLVRRATAVPYGELGRAVMAAIDGHPLEAPIRRLWIDRGANDLMRAMVQLMAVDERTDESADRLPGLRDRLAEHAMIGIPQWSLRQTGWMYRLVARKQARETADRAAATALKWAAWAEARGDHQQAADAAWRWVTASADDLRRRVLEDKEPRVRDLQTRFAQAADRLVRAGRDAQAAIALDRGRAVLLTERTGRAHVGLEGRLRDAGRSDLAERWLDARRRVEQSDRASFGRRASAAADGDARGSAEYRALAEHESLIREIAALPGFDDVGAPPTYDDLRAAAADGPLVQLVALEGRGFALVVGAEAAEPVAVPLPRLDRAWADAASSLMAERRRGRAAAEALGLLLREIWDRALEPIAPYLPSRTLVTLVPIGPLADLPLHAAAAAPGPDGIWRDRLDDVVFRYAPNARVLSLARGVAEAYDEVGGDDEPGFEVLTVHGGPPSDVGVAESAAVERLVADLGAPIVAAGDSADALLADAGAAVVWHLASHGRHEPAAPLDSVLELDRPLALRELFGRRPGGARLAVLSSCWSARLDQTRRDEVVGFPSAMLQAGVAGVVSCQTEVDEDAMGLLTLDLLRRVLEGTPPPYALAAARTWLRTATNAELCQRSYGAYARPAGADPERWDAARPFAAPWTWAVVTYTGA